MVPVSGSIDMSAGAPVSVNKSPRDAGVTTGFQNTFSPSLQTKSSNGANLGASVSSAERLSPEPRSSRKASNPTIASDNSPPIPSTGSSQLTALGDVESGAGAAETGAARGAAASSGVG